MRTHSAIASLSLLAASLLAACGTEHTLIRSDPSGAKVTINDKMIGTTPAEFAVNRSDWPSNNTFKCRLEMENYDPTDCTFQGARWRHVVGDIFTLFLIRIFRGPYGLADEYDYKLRPLTGLPQLDKLHASGVISDDEYKQLRLDLIRKAIESGEKPPQ